MENIFDEKYFDIDDANESISMSAVKMVNAIRATKKNSVNTSNTNGKTSSTDKRGLNISDYCNWADDLRDKPDIRAYYNKWMKYTDAVTEYDNLGYITAHDAKKRDEYIDKITQIEKDLVRYVYSKYKIAGCTMADAKHFANTYLDY